jgi:hypothetical protein
MDDLSIGGSGIFKSPTIIVLGSIGALMATRVFNVDGCPCFGGIYVKD